MNSFNHYSYGAVCDFLFGAVAGIEPILETPGYKEFNIVPVTGGSLTHAKADFDSPYGNISSAWKKQDGQICYRFEVPVNTTAHITLPDGQHYDVGSGLYQYSVEAAE